MKVRRKKDIKVRDDPGFGGIIYVHHRNDFFAANFEIYQVIKSLPVEFEEIPLDWFSTYIKLAELGICETTDPVIFEKSYSGPSFLGIFREVPCVEKPLVVNCFTTAYCPLSCIYCHADDLMKEYRSNEYDISTKKGQIDLRNVVSTAIMIPAMVAVLTGGDPLAKPERTIKLIESLAKQKPLVIDTSGYGDIDRLIPYLKEYDVHVRVSLDSLSRENDQWRIVNPIYRDRSVYGLSRESALNTIDKCLSAGLGLTVQTVVHSKNDRYLQLLDLRDGLLNLGVKNWVLHIAISGGLARKKEMAVERSKRARGSVLPGNNARTDIWNVIEETIKDGLNIDIRCTDNNSSPNSVLLINSEGDLYTEGFAHNGKIKLFDVKTQKPDQFRAMWASIDWPGHSRRYLNWNPWYYNHKDLEKTCYLVPLPKEDKQKIAIGLTKTQKKFKINNIDLLMEILLKNSISLSSSFFQYDEYYDNRKSSLTTFDYILRVRKNKYIQTDKESISINFIGPRFFAETGEYSQFELTFSTVSEDELQKEMKLMGLEKIWFFEKKRDQYIKDRCSVEISIDEIPEVGFYIELQGLLNEVIILEEQLKPAIDKHETRNYRDIYIDFKRSQGIDILGNQGPVFNN